MLLLGSSPLFAAVLGELLCVGFQDEVVPTMFLRL